MPDRVPIWPRVLRVARARSPRAVAATVRRAGTRELACRRIERGLTGSRPLLVGPFLGEVGFELLYWIPMLRRLLRQRGITPERVTVLTRGGAGAWYSDLAAHEIEILDLLSADALSSRLAERRARAGDAKQLTVERLDRELIGRALGQTGPATVVHPILMFTRLRWIWQGVQPVSDVPQLGDYQALPCPVEPVGAALAAELPDEYVALKAYFSDSFPATQANRAFLTDFTRALAETTTVVILSSGIALDDHEEWRPNGLSNVVDTGSLIDPRENLAAQSGLAAGARALVSTYGGFSYLGPFLGVPTAAFHSTAAFNTTHLGVLREARPGADYTVHDIRRANALEALVRRCAAAAETARR